ncbi:hypothetical protein AMAG_09352 [Allomyces macrogynus ATCC 38327]|uniref:CSD domain-containing protein n=1 Tax=Allomyces macrogynus (strain ATCC 38327) TaxID=578462 RepID=A0A0L0SPL9_ALLM3|nr:hypothetical protein AMAG_09352 [Allomyces macrogynus ATCC 38327]|eukprot:KNE64325.1 hypothetical protein AMAG_09352 [Allomyces macrogynus ATCC 38327]
MSDPSTSAGPAAPPGTSAAPGTPPMPSIMAPVAAPTTPVRGPSPLGPPRTPNAQYASSPHLMRARRGGSGSPSRPARMYPGSPRGRPMQGTGAYDRFASDRSAAAHYGYAPATTAWGQTYGQDTEASDGGRTGGEPLGRRTGRVKFFNSQKGYGFIIPDEPLEDLVEQEVFVHHTAIANHTTSFRSLAEDEGVEFDLIRGTKGYYSQNVTGPAGSPVIGDVKPSYHHHHHHHHHGGHHHRKGSHGSPLRRNIASPARAQTQHADGIPVATLSVTLPVVSQPGSGAPVTAAVMPSPMAPGAIPTYPAMPGAPIPPGVPFLVMHNGQWFLVPPNAYAPYPAPPPPPPIPAPGSDASPSLPPTDASAAGSPMIGANLMYPHPHGSPAAVAAAPAPYFLPYGYPAAAMAIPPPDASDAGMSPMLAPYGMPRPATPPFPPGIRSPGMDALDAQFHHMHLVDRRSSAGSLPGSPVVAPVPPPGMVPFPMAAAPAWFPPPPPPPMVAPAGIPPHAGVPVVQPQPQQAVPVPAQVVVAGSDAAAAAAPAAEGGAVVVPPRVEEEESGDASLADDYL